MDGWNQQFNRYRTQTERFPWWVVKIPLAVAVLILLPAAVLAVAALLVGLLVFAALLVVWRVLSVLFPPAPVLPADPNEGRVNVKVVGRS